MQTIPGITAPVNGHSPEALFGYQGLNGTGARPQGLTQTQPALSEAACSVNVFFEISGYGKAQATGRGHTAPEAAENLRQAIVATRAALGPPAPEPPKPVRLADLLACGLEKAVAKGDLCRVERLAKAAALVLSGAVEYCAMDGMWTVRSQSNPQTVYDVCSTGVCRCEDYQRHVSAEPGWFCKHGLAVLFTIRLAALDA